MDAFMSIQEQREADEHTSDARTELMATLRDSSTRLLMKDSDNLRGLATMLRAAGTQAAAAQAAGVPAERLKAVEAVLYHADKRIRYGAGGSDDAPGLHFTRMGYEEVLPLADGLEEWLGTVEGKAFLPPRDVAGTGQGAGQKPAAAPRVNGALDRGALRGSVAGGAFSATNSGQVSDT